MSRALANDVNDNLRIGMERLSEHVPAGAVRRFGSITAASAGFPIPIFNRVFVFDAPSHGDLSAAVEWMNGRAVPFWVTATDSTVDTVANLADDIGLGKADTQPGMAMASMDAVPRSESPVNITEVSDVDELHDFSRVSSSVFEMPEEVAKRVDRTALEVEAVHSFLGTVDREPVACGTLIRTGDVAGVYTIGVREGFRRQGIGKTMSGEVIRAGREMGCDVAVLQSSEMGYPLYESMGFETVVTYHLFEPVT